MRAPVPVLRLSLLVCFVIASTVDRGVELARKGRVLEALDILASSSLSDGVDAWRCEALLAVVSDDQALLSEVTARFDGGLQGGCSQLHDTFFSAAVALRALTAANRNLSRMPCSDRVSVAVELDTIGLPLFSSSHLRSALSSGVCGGEEAQALSVELHDATLCPTFFDSLDDIEWWRRRLEEAVRRITRECEAKPRSLRTPPPLDSFSFSTAFELVSGEWHFLPAAEHAWNNRSTWD
jgi:hypothetical protein